MSTEPELLNERLERLAIVLDEIMPQCALLVRDALSLMKEQEAVEPFHRCIGKDFSLIEDSHFDYCPYCGKPITWAKQEGR